MCLFFSMLMFCMSGDAYVCVRLFHCAIVCRLDMEIIWNKLLVVHNKVSIPVPNNFCLIRLIYPCTNEHQILIQVINESYIQGNYVHCGMLIL